MNYDFTEVYKMIYDKARYFGVKPETLFAYTILKKIEEILCQKK